MPSRSALIMTGFGISGVLLRSRYFTNSSTPPTYFISSRFSTAWRMSDSTMLTPEFRNASSRRRCSVVAKSNSTMVKVLGDGKEHFMEFADAVQPAGHLVGVLVEFSAGMQLGHDGLGRRNTFAGMDAGRNAAAVVDHTHRAVGIERGHHFGGKAGERLVDGVVDHFVDHVVEAGAVVGIADIHARPLAHGVEALEDLDRFRVVVAIVGRDI